MNVIFKYNEDFDIECLLDKGPGSNNQPNSATSTYKELLKYTPDVTDTEKVRDFVRKYIQENNLDLSSKITKFQNKWDEINAEFEKRAEKVFGVSIQDTISAYLTITGRFPYNIDKNLFFVSAKSDAVNSIVMHELWHFYTWRRFGQSEMDRLGPQKYNDIKEALTVLLNLECADLLNGESDDGYPQHQALRELITKQWIEERDIERVWTESLDQVLQKEKAPNADVSAQGSSS